MNNHNSEEYNSVVKLDWDEIEEALKDEIELGKTKPTEILIYNGKIFQEDENFYYYQFYRNENDQVNPNAIAEIRYGERILTNSSIENTSKYRINIKIDKSEKLPRTINELVLVDDPSFILEELLASISAIKEMKIDGLGLLYTIFGSQDDMRNVYELDSFDDFESDFEYNDKQILSVKKSKTNKILFIWGPPGTGKTTVLGKIITDYVTHEESVLLCSNTNRAVDISLLKTIEASEYDGISIKDKTLRWGNVYLKNEKDLRQVTFRAHHNRILKKRRREVREEIELQEEYEEEYNKKKKLETKLKPNTFRKKRLKELREETPKSKAIKNEINRLEEELKDDEIDLKSIKKQLTLINSKIKKIEKKIEKIGFDSYGDLKLFINKKTNVTFKEILKPIRFQAATFAKTIVDERINEQEFDNIIIDESSMAHLPYIIFLSTLAKKRIIFVGDPQQIAPIVLSQKKVTKKWMKRDIFMYVSGAKNPDDLFEWEKNSKDISVFLNEQYRMPKKIFKIDNILFYNNLLLSKTKTVGKIKVIDTSLINPNIKTKSHGTSKSPRNDIHARLLIEEIRNDLNKVSNRKLAAKHIGVIVPFRNQKSWIQNLCLKHHIPRTLEIGTIHTFQGREKSKIYFDLTLSNINFTYPTFDELKTSFIEVCRLLNVGLSRCQAEPEYHFDGEFTLIANIDYFRKNHGSRSIVMRFIDELVREADEIVNRKRNGIPKKPKPNKLPFKKNRKIKIEKTTNIKKEQSIYDVESQTLELKGSYCLNIDKLIFGDESLLKEPKELIKDSLKESVLKNIAGMMNTEGGEIYIGVLEKEKKYQKKLEKFKKIGAKIIKNRIVLGINFELEILECDEDKYMLTLQDDVENRIKEDAVNYVRMKSVQINNKKVLKLLVDRYPMKSGVQLDEKDYYLRQNNRSKPASYYDFFNYRQSLFDDVKQ